MEGAWWSGGASHLNAALSKKVFDRLKLLDTMSRPQRRAQTLEYEIVLQVN